MGLGSCKPLVFSPIFSSTDQYKSWFAVCFCLNTPCFIYIYVYIYIYIYTHICVYIYTHINAAAAKSLQSCLTLCAPIDGSPPGSPVPGILQARILEWVAVSFSNAWKWKMKVKSLSHVWLLATPWTAAYEAPPSMGFSKQEYWSGVPVPSLIYIDVNVDSLTVSSWSTAL